MAQPQQQDDDIQAVIDALGTIQGQSADIVTLATAVKGKQLQLKLAVDGAIKVIASLRSATRNVSALLQRANLAKSKQTDFIRDIRNALAAAPAEGEIDTSIADLKTVIENSGKQSVLTPEERSNIGFAGGFNWRSQSNRPKKSPRITRRRSKSKIKSRRTTRNKRKKSIRKSKSKSN